MINGGPNISPDGLVFVFDPQNIKSYPGESTTNIVPSPTINCYPTTGNGWGTFETNQYNSNTYFSIGTINDITDNIVTLSEVGRAIYTYDALNPQTTGGGVTAATNYFIEKLSSNSFCLHTYNSTQDGSLGFGVYSSFSSKISINNTSFPTMWKGTAHLPNAGLVKEIIPNGFNYEGRIHDCIRCHKEHYSGPNNGSYMAYGVFPPVTSGVTYTVSFYYRAVTPATIGKAVILTMYTSGNWSGYIGDRTKYFTDQNWHRYIVTCNAPNSGNTNLYFNISHMACVDISEIQFEAKDHATLFTTGTRDGNGVDLADHSALTFNGTIQDTDKSILFDGSDDYISIPDNILDLSGDWSINIWLKPNSDSNPRVVTLITTDDNLQIGYMSGTLLPYIRIDSSTVISSSVALSSGNWSNLVCQMSSSTRQIYINSSSIEIKAGGISADGQYSAIGGGYNSYQMNGNISHVSIYNRALSESEILQSYNALKNRYGL